MPIGSKSTWNQACNASVEAAKATNRAAFYDEAPRQGTIEYWCFGLEHTPGYLMKLPAFRTDLHALRVKHAREEMALAAKHLEGEIKENLDNAANLRAAAVSSVQQSNPTKADQILQDASTAYDITVANMGGNEFKELERRRQTLEASPPPWSETSSIRSPMLVKPRPRQPKPRRVFRQGGEEEAVLAPGDLTEAGSLTQETRTRND